MLAAEAAGEGDVHSGRLARVRRLRCFEGHDARLGNLEISIAVGYRESTVSAADHTLTRWHWCICRANQKYPRIWPERIRDDTSMMRVLQLAQRDPLRCRRSPKHCRAPWGFVIRGTASSGLNSRDRPRR